MTKLQAKSPALTAALKKYCLAHDLHNGKLFRYQAIADRLGFGYQRAWDIMNDLQPVTLEVLGRFLLAFGGEASAELLRLAGDPNDADKTALAWPANTNGQ